MKNVHSKEAPDAIGPYSQGVVVGNLLITSGQIALKPSGEELMDAPIEDQTKQVLKNLAAVAKAAGTALEHTVKLTVYLTNLGDFPKVNKVFTEVFSEPFPARSTVEVAGLPKRAAIEIDAIIAIP
jgi:2-iminobutanoate/2-iminopropanoate deaminase